MQEGPVEKAALLGVIRDGGIKVEEAVLGGDPKQSEVDKRVDDRVREIVDQNIERIDDDIAPHFADAAENGDGFVVYGPRAREGKVYPSLEEAESAADWMNANHEDEIRREIENGIDRGFIERNVEDELRADSETKFENWSSDDSNKTYRELLITLPLGQGGNPARAPATHWDQDAVVAHTRFMEKRDADGKRVLFIEEVQSDWHQKGRDEGYGKAASAEEVASAEAAEVEARAKFDAKAAELHPYLETLQKTIPAERQPYNLRTYTPSDPAFAKTALMASNLYLLPDDQQAPARAILDEAHDLDLRSQELSVATNLARDPKGVPEAPFKTTWPALVMKRVIRWAADHGFERVAWTTGAEQAERYGLEKHIGLVELSRSAGGTGNPPMGPLEDGQRLRFIAYRHEGGSPLVDTFVESRKELEQYLPADVAARLWEKEPSTAPGGGGWRDAMRTLSGLDLKTGGEGMKAFYDRNLVNITNDIVKKHGAKVGPVVIPGSSAAQSYFNDLRREAEEARRDGDTEAAAIFERRLADAIAAEPESNPGFDITPELAEAATGGFPLFQRGRGGPVDEATFNHWRDLLAAEMKRLKIDDRVLLNVVDRLEYGPKVGGAYFQRVISVALAVSHDPMQTVSHEAIHALKAMGMFRDVEWRALVKAVRSNPAIMERIHRNYGDQGLTESQLEEEAIAEAYGYWRTRRAAKGFIARAFQRIDDLLNAIANALKGRVTAGDVFRGIERGKIGARRTGQEAATQEPTSPVEAQPEGTGTLFQRTDDASASLDLARALEPGSKFQDHLDAWRTALQDRMLPVMRVEAAVERALGRELTAEERPYGAEELMSGRVGARFDALETTVNNLFEAMRVEKVSADELESYLYARHAPERNAAMAKINDKIPHGSGMSDIEAAAILTRIESAGKTEAMQRLAAHIDAMLSAAVETRVESGLMSRETADAWRAQYGNYVPLRGFAEMSDDERPNIGRGINVRGPESKRAFGRRSQADDIIAHTIMQAEEAIFRAEKNRVAQALLNLTQAAPDENFWQVNKVTMKRRINPETGLVEDYAVHQLTADDKDWTVSLKVDGKERRVTFNRRNPDAARAAAAMRRLDEQKMNAVVATLGKLNRFLSTVNTSLSPEFVITNAFRDFQEAAVNMAGLNVKGLEAATIKDYRKALFAATKGAFGKEEGDWGRWWKEFTEEGGRVYYNDMRTLDDLRRDIEKRFDPSRRPNPDGLNVSPKQLFLIAKGDLAKMFHFIEAVNTGVENSIRLSAYKNARELGVSKADAARMAKNLTVNFNKRGVYGPVINSAYLFANASMQGSARVLMALKSKRVQKIVAGIVMAGFLQEVLNAALSDRDDDGELVYDKLSEFEKSRNFVVMAKGPWGAYLKFPMPWGYGAFHALGRNAAAMMRGRGIATGLGNIAVDFIDAFNPVGGTNSILNLLAPTIVDPVVDLERNRDFANRPIMPDQPEHGTQIPNAQRYWGNVSPHWKAVTDFLTTASGGDKVQKGKIDVSPEVLEYLFGQATGSAGAFFDRTAGLVGKLAKVADGDPNVDLSINDVPLARKVIGQKPVWYDKAAFLCPPRGR
jgi:hypothetical protein